MSNINFLAVIIATFVNIAVGSLWYSKLMFANTWMKLTGKSMSDMKGANKSMAIMGLVSLIEAYFLSVVIHNFGSTGLSGGVKTAILVWFGFIVTTRSSDVLFEQRPAKLYQIHIAYQFVAFVLMGAVLSLIG